MLFINVCVCVLNFYFAYLSLRHRTIFYIGTLLILMACVCVRACVRECALVQVCVCAFGCCFVSANGLLADVCQCCCLLMFVCLPLSRQFPCCKTWWIKNLNLNFWVGVASRCSTKASTVAVAKITGEKGWRVEKKCLCVVFWLTRRSRFCEKNAFWGILFGAYCLLPENILITGLQKCLSNWQCKLLKFTVTAFYSEKSAHRK